MKHVLPVLGSWNKFPGELCWWHHSGTKPDREWGTVVHGITCSLQWVISWWFVFRLGWRWESICVFVADMPWWLAAIPASLGKSHGLWEPAWPPLVLHSSAACRCYSHCLQVNSETVRQKQWRRLGSRYGQGGGDTVYSDHVVSSLHIMYISTYKQHVKVGKYETRYWQRVKIYFVCVSGITMAAGGR